MSLPPFSGTKSNLTHRLDTCLACQPWYATVSTRHGLAAAVSDCWASPPAQSAAVPCIAYDIAQTQARRRLLMRDRRRRAESLLLRRSSELRWIAVPID